MKLQGGTTRFSRRQFEWPVQGSAPVDDNTMLELEGADVEGGKDLLYHCTTQLLHGLPADHSLHEGSHLNPGHAFKAVCCLHGSVQARPLATLTAEPVTGL